MVKSHRSVLLVTLQLGFLTIVRCQLSPANTLNPLDVVNAVKNDMEGRYRNLRNFSPLPDVARYKEMLFQNLGDNLPRDQESLSSCAGSIVDMGKFEPYSIQMLDAWGKPPSGIVKGNLKWPGRYYECIDARAKDFSGKWCMIILGNPGTDLFGIDASSSLDVGTCFPDTCSQADIDGLFGKFTNETGIPAYAYCPVQPTKYTSIDIIALIICSVLGTFLICATGYDIYLLTRKHQGYDELLIDANEIAAIENSNPSVLSQIVLSFSVIKNTKAILDTSQKDGNINVLHGLRFISMTWVILGHSFIFSVRYVDNPLDFAAYYVKYGSFQAVGNATLSVDSFFFLSGLLATYLGMREMIKRKGQISVFLPYLYRYLRLTPAYALCIMLSASLYSKMGDGPSWPAVAETMKMPCRTYWWTNLLYINNLHPSTLGDECFGWGWYLANDTQFFLLLPFLLWILYRKPIIGLIILGFGTLGSMVSTGVVSAHYKQQPQNLGIGLLCSYMLGISKSGNETMNVNEYTVNVTTPQPPPPEPSQADPFWSDTYTKPWCRIGVYLIGAATGYLLYWTKCRMYMHKAVAVLMWLVATAVGFSVVYGLNGSITSSSALSVNVAAFYNAVFRPLWGACLAWLVLACTSGYGGPVNHFLSWKAFIPLSRLTYCAYLVHPLVIYWGYSVQETYVHFSTNLISLYFLGFVVVAYAVAYVVSVVIEMPIIGLLKLLVKGQGRKKESEFKTLTTNNAVNHTEA